MAGHLPQHRSLQDTFETNLNQTRAEEAQSSETFQALRKAKETEIHATEEAPSITATACFSACFSRGRMLPFVRPLSPRRLRRLNQTRRKPGQPRHCKMQRRDGACQESDGISRAARTVISVNGKASLLADQHFLKDAKDSRRPLLSLSLRIAKGSAFLFLICAE